MNNERDHSRALGTAFARTRESLRHTIEVVRRSFVEFLTIPTVVIAAFLLLALLTFILDDSRNAGGEASSQPMWFGLFSDTQAARDFLGVVASSIITVTSITFSLLLVAVQQGAAALTSLVFDQFLRRRANQLYFGFFIGLALYSLIVLASINSSHQPVYGVATAGLMTAVALYMLIFLIYNTIDQMRPVVIIRLIHDYTLLARERQLDLLRGTRRWPRLEGTTSTPTVADRSGFLARIDISAIAKAVTEPGTEIIMLASIGDYVAFGDVIAEIRTTATFDMSSLDSVIRKAAVLEEQRDLDTDPAFGVEQLAMIGWTSISTAKSNPHPGLLSIWNLGDLLARWLQSDDAFASDDNGDQGASIVYPDDLPDVLLGVFESFAVVASESMQHQSSAEVYRTFAKLFPRLPPHLQRRADDLLRRSLSALGDHILTSDLDAALSELVMALTAAAHADCAREIDAARRRLGLSIGRLNSRSTRSDPSSQRL